MKLNRSDLNPGTWIWFNEKKPDDGGICLRVCNRRKLREIREQTVSIKFEYREGKRYEIQDIDEEKSQEMLWDYVIVDWKNLEDDDGVKFVCDAKTKLELMSEHPGFATFVQESLDRLNRDMLDFAEDSEKN